MQPVKVKIKKFFKDAIIPKYMTELASGADCFAYLDPETFGDRIQEDDKGKYIELTSLERVLVPIGFATEFPSGYEVQVRARSGLSYRNGLGLANSVGSIDCDYRGQYLASMINFDPQPQRIYHADRLCQIIMAPVVIMDMEEVSDLSDTDRSGGGFGHTGRQ